MCGIAGYVSQNYLNQRDELEKVVSALESRGPDNQKSLAYPGWGLGHTRLKIVDLSDNGIQPMNDPEQNWHISFNGEIYNYKKLINNFSIKNSFTFKSETDFEFILPLLRSKDFNFLRFLNGIYAFAAYSTTDEILLLARDPLGIKPLYYTFLNDCFWFASEIKALLKLKDLSTHLSSEAFSHYFSLGYFVKSQTPYKNICQLLPGHNLIYDRKAGTIKITKFFDLASIEQSDQYVPQDLILETKKRVSNALTSQLIGQREIGIMLSGGIDSGIIASLLSNEYQQKSFHSFTLTFDHKNYNEIARASLLAKNYNSTHHIIPVTANEYRSHLSNAIKYLDQPSGDPSVVPIYMLNKYAKNYLNVLLSGDGGDEFFAGYETLKATYYYHKYHNLPPSLKKYFFDPILNNFPGLYEMNSKLFKLKHFAKGISHPLPMALFCWRESLSLELKKNLLVNDFNNKENLDSSILFDEIFYGPNGWDAINRQLLIDASLHFTDKIQLKTDRMSMAHSIETRVPFADIDLISWAFSINGNEKFRNNNLKYLLKNAFLKDLPKNYMNAKKQGLFVPISFWMKNEWKNWLDIVFNTSGKWTNYINQKYLLKIWREQARGEKDHSRSLFTILTFIIWIDQIET